MYEIFKEYNIIHLTLFNFIRIAVAKGIIKPYYCTIFRPNKKNFKIIEGIHIFDYDIEINIFKIASVDVFIKERNKTWLKARMDGTRFLTIDLNHQDNTNTIYLLLDIFNSIINLDDFKKDKIIDLLFTSIKFDLSKEINQFKMQEKLNEERL